MKKLILYRYERADGGITVSPTMPDGEYTTMYRLIADEGKELTNNGTDFVTCVDVNSDGGWYEVEAAPTAEDYEAALAELGVV